MATPIIENEKKCTCDLKLGSNQIASENSSMNHVTASDGTRVGRQKNKKNQTGLKRRMLN